MSIILITGILQLLVNDLVKLRPVESELMANYSGLPPDSEAYFRINQPLSWGFAADLNDQHSGVLYQNESTGLLGNITHIYASEINNTYPYFLKMKDKEDIDQAFILAAKTVRKGLTSPSYRENSDEAKKLQRLLPTGAFVFRNITLTDEVISLDYTLMSGRQSNAFDDLPYEFLVASSAEYRGYYMNAIHDALLKLILLMDPSQDPISSMDSLLNYVIYSMPYKPLTKLDLASGVAGFMFHFALMFLLPVFVYHLVMEKQGRLREYMKIMGMDVKIYWGVTFFYDFILYLVVIIAFILLGLAFQLRYFTTVHPMVYLLLFLLWGCSLISFSFAVSSLFNKTRAATVVSYLLVIISAAAANVINGFVVGFEKRANVGYLFYPPFALARGNFLISQSLVASNTGPYGLSAITDTEMSTVYAMLFVDTLLWLFIAWYLEQVLPKDYGTRKPFYFIVSSPINYLIEKYRKGSPNKRLSRISQIGGGNIEEGIEEHEDEDVAKERSTIQQGNLPENVGILISNLRKVYKGQDGNPDKVAVKNLCLSIYKGECFGLLGPNGAGKTTTISILTGMYPLTSGYAEIGGYDISSEMDMIRKNLGVCPQHDILWDNLTVEEHLLFYARLKGCPKKEEKQVVQESMENVGLETFATRFSKDLSGGMKRRLSVAISLIFSSEYVFLDEPTTGLDPESRRSLWNIINEAKKKRCIVLTTHSMEEADVLCSRIGIMSHGKLQCLGNQLHLKKKFGKGFKLSILTGSSDNEKTIKFVETILPGAKLTSSFHTSLEYQIPREVELHKVFENIENNKESAGIKDWSLNETSLEEVFLSIVKDQLQDESQKKKKSFCTII